MNKKQKEQEAQIIEQAMLSGREVPGRDEPEKFDFDNFEINTIEDFKTYNDHIRKHNRLCLHERNKMKVKVPDESFHKKIKVKFQRFDQPENVLKVRVRNKDIDWKGQLKGGCTYDLPIPVVQFLNALAVPIFSEVKTESGGETRTETKQVGERSRFSCNQLEFV